MTAEDAFQQKLDDNIEDHFTRMVLADYLDDIGDPRAAGYRVLGLARIHPWENDCWYWWNIGRPGSTDDQWIGKSSFDSGELSYEWWIKIDDGRSVRFHDVQFRTRREAEDESAIAWSKMSIEDQESILKQVHEWSQNVQVA